MVDYELEVLWSEIFLPEHLSCLQTIYTSQSQASTNSDPCSFGTWEFRGVAFQLPFVAPMGGRRAALAHA